MTERHPFNDRWTVPEATEILIVGTAPPPRFSLPTTEKGLKGLDFDFFYGSEDNDMWIMLDEIAYDRDRQKLFRDDYSSEHCSQIAREYLTLHRLWMRDVLGTYERKPGREASATDSDIAIPNTTNFADFRPVFGKCASLRRVAFTSQQAARWTFRALTQQGLLSPIRMEKELAIWRAAGIDSSRYDRPLLTSRIGENIVDFLLLPSPSWRSPEPYTTKKEVYRRILFGELSARRT